MNEDSLIVTYTTNISGASSTKIVNYTLQGDAWVTNDPDVDAITSTSVVGTETIQTALGSKECTHTKYAGATFVEDDWSDDNTGCCLRAHRVFSNGDQKTIEIIGTNTKGI